MMMMLFIPRCGLAAKLACGPSTVSRRRQQAAQGHGVDTTATFSTVPTGRLPKGNATPAAAGVLNPTVERKRNRTQKIQSRTVGLVLDRLRQQQQIKAWNTGNPGIVATTTPMMAHEIVASVAAEAGLRPEQVWSGRTRDVASQGLVGRLQTLAARREESSHEELAASSVRPRSAPPYKTPGLTGRSGCSGLTVERALLSRLDSPGPGMLLNTRKKSSASPKDAVSPARRGAYEAVRASQATADLIMPPDSVPVLGKSVAAMAQGAPLRAIVAACDKAVNRVKGQDHRMGTACRVVRQLAGDVLEQVAVVSMEYRSFKHSIIGPRPQ